MNSFAMFLSSLCNHDLTARLSLDMYRDCNNIHAYILQIKSKQADYEELAKKIKSSKTVKYFEWLIIKLLLLI